MELAVITAKQVAELLLMILAGAVCCKAGVFKPKEKSVLANLLLYLVVPAMVLDSYMVEYDPATFHNLMLAFGLGALVLLVGLGVAFLQASRCKRTPAPSCGSPVRSPTPGTWVSHLSRRCSAAKACSTPAVLSLSLIF